MTTAAHAPLAGPTATSSAPESEPRSAALAAGGNFSHAITLRELVDAYMAQYAGRDESRAYRLEEWVRRFGDRPVAGITDDDVFHALEQIAGEPARIYKGRDADGKPIYRAKGARSPATVNRYHAALGAVFAWAIRRRRVPKGFENPCRKVERQPENNAVVRFLSEDERTRLLAAARASRWPRLYLLVLMGITTGARRGELQALRWADIDLDRAVAYVRTSKNGEPKVLPLVPAVVEELRRFAGGKPQALLFASRVRPDVAYNIDAVWQHALRSARIRNFRFHDLRHTCASYLAQQGASLLEIADVMGHRQLAMVKRYSHLTTDTKAALVKRVLGGIR